MGSHWARGSCYYPEIPTYLREILIGCLMGDGSVPKTNDGSHGLFRLPMVNKQFLEWFDHEMGILSTGVVLKKTAAELARNNRESGFSPNARAENYHDMYTVISRSHPFMRSLRRWYRSGEKRFPESLSLTPRIAKMWYVCDGCLDVQEHGEPRASIRIRHRDDRQDFLLNLFEEVGITPSYGRETIRFGVEETRSLLDWMGNPPTGFEYKWVLDSRERYDRLKAQAYGEAHAL